MNEIVEVSLADGSGTYTKERYYSWLSLTFSGVSYVGMDGEPELPVNDVTEDTSTLHCMDAREHLKWVRLFSSSMGGGFRAYRLPMNHYALPGQTGLL